jgi:D-glycero-D-manno-heptose 1,7-bisphosphate phosphatase
LCSLDVQTTSSDTRPPKLTTLTRAIFFDRDGVINARILGGYVRHWNEFELLSGVIETLREVKRRGYLAIIVTNQRGVGLGIMTEGDLHAVHEELQRAMEAAAGVRFDDIIFCTDLDNALGRRKPSPAMLLEAAEKWNIDLAESWMIGDSMSDIEAGQRAGTKTAYLITKHSEEIPRATKIIHRLTDLLTYI